MCSRRVRIASILGRSRNGRLPLLFCVLAACASRPTNAERIDTARQPFESAGAVLVDFDFDGSLIGDTRQPAEVMPLIKAQLMYAIGQLNGDNSVGRYERLEVSAVDVQSVPSSPGRYRAAYHARLPVAWGGGAPPAAYTLELPASVGQDDQIGFATKYGSTCVDPEEGTANAGDMFLFYRPKLVGCAIASADVVTMPVTVTMSAENTTGKYPEYDRIWQDGALDVVSLFTREYDDGTQPDEGIEAYDAFVQRVGDYLAALQPDATRRTAWSSQTFPQQMHAAATLADGRVVNIEGMLVGTDLAAAGSALDDWYDARTADADVVLYDGHAGHGDNVQTLMAKGTFRTGKYLVWVVNGCDTFAYVDRTLADRRAALNLDDPAGTKYMDTVANILGGYFHSEAATSMELIRDVVAAGDPGGEPKTYPQIFAAIDPSQIIVVVGEEDNRYSPPVAGPPAAPSPVTDTIPRRDSDITPPGAADATPPASPVVSGGGGKAGCNMARRRGVDGAAMIGLASLILLLARRRARAIDYVNQDELPGRLCTTPRRASTLASRSTTV
jgi:hypothetical protein